MLLCQQSLLAIQKKKRNIVVSLCCDHFKEVKYDSEWSLKEEKRKERQTKKGNGASKGYAVLCTFGVLAALDEWMSLKEPRLFTENG